MVFLDLDGTTLDPNKRMTPATAEALHLLKSQGIPFTFASARPAAMMTLHCQKAGLTGPIIAMEGADLRIWETGSTIRHFPIEEDTALELMEFCHNSGLDYTFYTPHAAHFRQSSQRLPRFRRYNDLAVAAGLPPVQRCVFENALLTSAAQNMHASWHLLRLVNQWNCIVYPCCCSNSWSSGL